MLESLKMESRLGLGVFVDARFGRQEKPTGRLLGTELGLGLPKDEGQGDVKVNKSLGLRSWT